jgi:hypothetical protein
LAAFWKEDWDTVRQHHIDWWKGEGMVLFVHAPRDEPLEVLPCPEKPATLEAAWTDPVYRARKAEYDMSRTYFGGDAFPRFDTAIGPGNLATFIGSEPIFTDDSVWYRPCIDNPDGAPPLRLDPAQKWFRVQRAIVEEGIKLNRGRFVVGMPDLIENIDTLSSLRGALNLMADLIDQPDWVKEKLAEINQVFYAAFDIFYAMIETPWGGNCFSPFEIWGPGKTGKVQCDAAAMFSPQMFAEFVVPPMTEQCQWLDYSMYHLDGAHSLCHLDHLLAIDALDAIEWTPNPKVAPAGHSDWYGLYRRILDAGKSVHATYITPDLVIPLLDAVGGRGMYIAVEAASEAEARALVEQAEQYR